MKRIAPMVLVLFAASLLVVAKNKAEDTDNKVPSEFGVRIRNVQLAQANAQNLILQLQSQYNAEQAELQHDTQEVNDIDKEALVAAKKDDTWTVDNVKLEFTVKTVPVPAKK